MFKEKIDQKKSRRWHYGYMMSHVMKKLLIPYANNKGADQPACICRLICPFVVYSEIVQKLCLLQLNFQDSSLLIVSVAEQAGLNPTNLNRKCKICHSIAHCYDKQSHKMTKA